jgi:hypothetical protein
MSKTAVRSVAVSTCTIVTIIVGYMGFRAHLGTLHEPLSPSNGQFSAREREEAFLACLKMQGDGCYMD